MLYLLLSPIPLLLILHTHSFSTSFFVSFSASVFLTSFFIPTVFSFPPSRIFLVLFFLHFAHSRIRYLRTKCVCTHTNIQIRIHRIIHECKYQSHDLIHNTVPRQKCHTNTSDSTELQIYRPINAPSPPTKKKVNRRRILHTEFVVGFTIHAPNNERQST
jgi:hypothetical protein